MNFYDRLYDPKKSDYGYSKDRNEEGASAREMEIYGYVQSVFQQCQVPENASVLEVGASFGFNHHVHPQYRGIEFSEQAVNAGKERFGDSLNVAVGDTTDMPEVDSASIDFLFTFATLEHVPFIEEAFFEIYRVLAPKGRAYLAPAWNCRPWTVEKLKDLSYSELALRKKIGKFLIPLREHLAFRFMCQFPQRVAAEINLALGRQAPLRYQSMYPNIELIEKYGHVSDDDAFVNIDSHAAMVWFLARGCVVPSHPTCIKRLFARGEPILIEKV